MQDAGLARRQRRRVPTVCTPSPARLAADEAHPWVGEERVEQADRVRPAPDAGDRRIRQPPGPLEDLAAGLHPDHPLEVADHGRERMRSGDRAEDVVRGLDVGDPVAERLVDRVLEGPGAGGDGDHLGAEHRHPGHVERLPADVDLAHVDDALQAEQRARGRGGHPVLARPGLRDDPRLAHPPGQQRLAERVVDLVGAGVVQVLPLEEHPRAAGLRCEPGNLGERARTPGVVLEQLVELRDERGIRLRLLVLGGDLIHGGDQRLGDERAAELAEVPLGAWGLARQRRDEEFAVHGGHAPKPGHTEMTAGPGRASSLRRPARCAAR